MIQWTANINYAVHRTTQIMQQAKTRHDESNMVGKLAEYTFSYAE